MFNNYFIIIFNIIFFDFFILKLYKYLFIIILFLHFNISFYMLFQLFILKKIIFYFYILFKNIFLRNKNEYIFIK